MYKVCDVAYSFHRLVHVSRPMRWPYCCVGMVTFVKVLSRTHLLPAKRHRGQQRLLVEWALKQGHDGTLPDVSRQFKMHPQGMCVPLLPHCSDNCHYNFPTESAWRKWVQWPPTKSRNTFKIEALDYSGNTIFCIMKGQACSLCCWHIGLTRNSCK